MTVRVLSAGATKGLVGALQAGFTESSGEAVAGSFSAVGAIRERFLSGEACDVLILTATQLAALATDGQVEYVAAIGTVRTAVAVPAGHAVPEVSSGAAFATAIRAASAVFMPDPYQSTAGIHVRGVFDTLGLAAVVGAKLRAFANGETAMRELSQARLAGSIGTTQVTEIRYTPGLTLVGPLPPEFDLATVYAAAVSAVAVNKDAARALVALLTGAQSAALRRESGFE